MFWQDTIWRTKYTLPYGLGDTESLITLLRCGYIVVLVHMFRSAMSFSTCIRCYNVAILLFESINFVCISSYPAGYNQSHPYNELKNGICHIKLRMVKVLLCFYRVNNQAQPKLSVGGQPTPIGSRRFKSEHEHKTPSNPFPLLLRNSEISGIKHQTCHPLHSTGVHLPSRQHITA
jgi:hypothetical protein